ncbi:Eukaryotic peptide chain release factor GTP-binding subunit [Vermiconidia calcicola]|uniref:Eukaryotic peptide chain release factor GTP-binding subunit n=1 Tax=Vermiconidia calcicola TaxID=1690605 RepID=A0ACC3N8F4_9PEZI|nr:Eukaryotic peptide chain release factor GTP-binding subunit [Vermiconidia calcicola]
MPPSPDASAAGTAAFPTFLSSDPYPSQDSNNARPRSSTSATTDATSEFGGETDYRSAKERQSNATGLTGPVGEPGLPPSRPTSTTTSVQSHSQRAGGRTSLQPPSSRRGFAMFASGGSSRPDSSVGKTHVPGVAASGFFRPMSSSKLQAQRNQLPISETAQGGANGDNKAQGERRYSNASVNTLRDATSRSKTQDKDAPPLPVSRGTQFTSDGGTTQNDDNAASVTSATPLQLRASRPSKLEVNGSNTPTSSDKAPKSPRSFRASLGLGSRPSPSPQHEKLHSNPSTPQQYDAEKQHPPNMPSTKPQSASKNYEYTASNHAFLLRGRLLTTKAKPLSIMTFLLTVLPAALFFAFSAPWLWHNVSPAIPVVFGYIFYITISSFLHGAFSDPGVLPRNAHPHPRSEAEERDPLTPGPATTEWIMVKTFPSRDVVSASENGAPATAMEVPTKYCKSCSIWRPPRTHHCRICDACIETQDHHCVWLNNCVGRRNYRFFFSYVAFGSLLALLLLAFSLVHVGLYARQHNLSFSSSLSGRVQERMAFAMFIYSVLALPYPGSLFAYHLFLIARGETTREYLNSHKFLPKDRHRPFAQASLLRNWVAVLVRPRPPTYLQFRKSHDPGDARLGHTVPKKERKRELKNRYSVQGANGAVNGSGGGKDDGHEMKQLPPPPPKSSHGQKAQAKGAGGGGLGNMNSTPR